MSSPATHVLVERAKPLSPYPPSASEPEGEQPSVARQPKAATRGAVMFNGITWLQCATNGLDEAEWLDIEGGRYTEEGQSFFIQRIDFEHKLTPEAFPTEAEGTKTMRVIVRE